MATSNALRQVVVRKTYLFCNSQIKPRFPERTAIMSRQICCIIGNFLLALFCSTPVWAITSAFGETSLRGFGDLRQKAAADPNISGRVIYIRESAGGDVTEEDFVFDGNAGLYKLTTTDLQDANSSRVLFGKKGWCLQFYPVHDRDRGTHAMFLDECDCGAVPDFSFQRGGGKVQVEDVNLGYRPSADEFKVFIAKGTDIESTFPFSDGSPRTHIVHTAIRVDTKMGMDEIVSLCEESKELFKEQGRDKTVERRNPYGLHPSTGQ
jgi:hypothetical protein